MNHQKKYRVVSIRNISKTAFVLRLERNNFEFVPGQSATIGIPKMATNREYSIYSGLKDNYLEFLVKEVLDGVFSPKLRQLQKGDLISVDGAYGLFNITQPNDKHIFVATGTGIAPFHSMIKSYPNIDYTLLHGIKNKNEEYDKNDYQNYVACVSPKRVTDYLKQHQLTGQFFLCGNSSMINDVYDILRQQGINGSNIHSESFF